MPSVKTWPQTAAAMIQAGRVSVRGFLMLLVAGTALAAESPCPVASPIRLNLPVTRAAVTHGQPILIVALGSSSTEGAGASAPDRAYPARLEALLRTSWPAENVTTLNRGIGGQMLDAVLPRLDTDVIAVRPTLVIWQVGTNEALRAMDPVQFDRMLDEGLQRLSTIGADVVLMDYQIAPKMPPAPQREIYGAIIAKEALKHAVPLFSRAALMRDWQMADPTASDMIGLDGLHHSDRGYACLAASLDTAIVSAATPRVEVVNLKAK
jgi:acyl-CoA thioesterase-1